MAEPKDIVDFDTLTPAATDYMILQRSASVGGKATAQAVVNAANAAAANSAKPWPYVLTLDTADGVGSGTAPGAVVKSFTIPANTLGVNGARLTIEAYVVGINAADDWAMYLQGTGLELFTTIGLTPDEFLQLSLVRQTSSTAVLIENFITAIKNDPIDWTIDQTVQIFATAGVTIEFVIARVFPSG